MKLGNGKIKFKFKFIYEMTGRVTFKYVYADNLEQAERLFSEYYKGCLDVRILNISAMEEQ